MNARKETQIYVLLKVVWNLYENPTGGGNKMQFGKIISCSYLIWSRYMYVVNITVSSYRIAASSKNGQEHPKKKDTSH